MVSYYQFLTTASENAATVVMRILGGSNETHYERNSAVTAVSMTGQPR